MDKILYLESDEEITSVLGRLKNSRDKSIALVVPEGAVILGSAINLKLLFAQSKKLGKKVSIVTSDRAGGNIASQIGFTVYENLGDARETREKLPPLRRQPRKELGREAEEYANSDVVLASGDENLEDEERFDEEDDFEEEDRGYAKDLRDEEDLEEDENSRYVEDFRGQEALKQQRGGSIFDDFEQPQPYSHKKTRGVFYENSIRKSKKSKIVDSPFFSLKFWLFGVIAFAMVLFLLVFIFPKATVYLNVYASEEEISIPFKLSVAIQNVDKKDKVVLPAKWESKEQEVNVEVDATGQKNIGDKAKGPATVYNRSGKSVEIAQGTEFLTGDNKRYILTAKTTVPGASVSEFGELMPGSIGTNLESAEGGASFNIGKSRFYIPALSEVSGNLVYAQTEEGMGGGTDKQAKVATKENIEGGKNKAKEEAMKKMEEDFGMKGEKVFVKGLGTTEILQEEISKKENEEADKIGIKLKVRYSFLVFSKKDFDATFEEMLKLQLGDKKELVGRGYRDVGWEIAKFDDKKKEADVVGKAKVLTAAKINEEFIKSKIITLDVSEMRTFLSQYSDVELDRVRFFPPLLLSSIPSNERNIRVVISHPEK